MIYLGCIAVIFVTYCIGFLTGANNMSNKYEKTINELLEESKRRTKYYENLIIERLKDE